MFRPSAKCNFQGNARRLLDKRCDGNSRFGKLSKLGLAPILWCIIFLLLMTYIHSVIMGTFQDLIHFFSCSLSRYCFKTSCASLLCTAPTLPKLTSGLAFLAWLGVLSATAGLVLFYRCSR